MEINHTHYAHKKEIQHTRISKRAKSEIAAKLQLGVPRERILDDQRFVLLWEFLLYLFLLLKRALEGAE